MIGDLVILELCHLKNTNIWYLQTVHRLFLQHLTHRQCSYFFMEWRPGKVIHKALHSLSIKLSLGRMTDHNPGEIGHVLLPIPASCGQIMSQYLTFIYIGLLLLENTHKEESGRSRTLSTMAGQLDNLSCTLYACM